VNPALIYDSDRKNLVLFGGHGKQMYGDTWLWSGSCWRQATPMSAPSPRTFMAAAYDPNRHILLMYGGQSAGGGWLDDTWAWDGTNWAQLQLTPRPALHFAVGVFDPDIGKLVLFGLSSDHSSSQTWIWNGNWQQVVTSVSPSPRYSTALAYDPSTRSVILFGGKQTLDYLGDTWAFDGANWNQVSSTASPSARQFALMATIPQGVLLFGGEVNLTKLSDTWMWKGNGWQAVPAQHSPAVGWRAVGIASRDGQVVALTYSSFDGPAQTYLFSQGDWSAT
jgi:hypothetical protein